MTEKIVVNTRKRELNVTLHVFQARVFNCYELPVDKKNRFTSQKELSLYLPYVPGHKLIYWNHNQRSYWSGVRYFLHQKKIWFYTSVHISSASFTTILLICTNSFSGLTHVLHRWASTNVANHETRKMTFWYIIHADKLIRSMYILHILIMFCKVQLKSVTLDRKIFSYLKIASLLVLGWDFVKCSFFPSYFPGIFYWVN